MWRRFCLAACIGVIGFGLAGCSNSDSYQDPITEKKSSVVQGDVLFEANTVLSVEDIIVSQGLIIEKSITHDGDTGYLARDKNGKPYLFLQGLPYNMGYQMGYLMPEGTYRMTREYTRYVGQYYLNIPFEKAKWLYDFIIDQTLILCRKVDIPTPLVDEMKGLAQGATDGLAIIEGSAYKGMRVDYDDVLLLNEGNDALYSMGITGHIPALEELRKKVVAAALKWPGIVNYVKMNTSSVSFLKLNPHFMGCNEFVASGNATVGDKVYHGRDFMFAAGLYDVAGNRALYSDYACMAVYLPKSGVKDKTEYPFVAVTSPGFVGLTTALNSQGLSMGQDVVVAACTNKNPGIGSMLVVRDVIQHNKNIDEAISYLKDLKRGVSWIYIIGSSERSEKYTNGVVIEEGMRSYINSKGDDVEFTGPDLMSSWERYLFGRCIKTLPSELPDDGIMVRSQSWEYPAAFENNIHFPKQIEKWPDVVVASNHFIIPRMALTQMTYWMIAMGFTPESKWRYNQLINCFKNEFGSNDDAREPLDYETARSLVDYLNPYSLYWTMSGTTADPELYYKKGGPIEGHHAIIDNKALTIESLFGYYNEDEPWARVDLKAFIQPQM